MLRKLIKSESFKTSISCISFLFLMYLIPSLLMAGKNNANKHSSEEMALISAGTYRPLYLSKDSPLEVVNTFYIDRLPVSNSQFNTFIAHNSEWDKNSAPSIFVENNYLAHWLKQNADKYTPSKNDLNKPVVNVSWFAAQAYCESQNKRLPTVAEWEYVASASEKEIVGNDDPEYHQKILNWYSKPSSIPLGNIDQSSANYWGVKDLHALIWEWTEDFNTALVSGESRGDSSIDKNLFCGAGASGSADPSNYAAFMRFGFRSSLQAKFTLSNLGFRCAASQLTEEIK